MRKFIFLLLLILVLIVPIYLADAENKDMTDYNEDGTEAQSEGDIVKLYPRLTKDMETKRTELDKVEKEINIKQQQLALLKDEIAQSIADMEKKQDNYEQKCAEVKASYEERVKALVAMYTAMPPEEAASRVSRLDSKSIIALMRNMNPKKAGTILSFIEPKMAANISEDLLGQ